MCRDILQALFETTEYGNCTEILVKFAAAPGLVLLGARPAAGRLMTKVWFYISAASTFEVLKCINSLRLSDAIWWQRSG